jgi:hypothetical protein
MGGQAPAPPPYVPPPPPPPTATFANPAVGQAASNQAAQSGTLGYLQTMLTGGQGAPPGLSNPNTLQGQQGTAGKTLTGQ